MGQGDEYDLINDLKIKWNLKNVTIAPSISQRKYEKILAVIDVGVFSLSKKHAFRLKMFKEHYVLPK